MTKLYIIDIDDWIGFYVNGKLVHEGHNLEGRDVLDALKLPYEIEFLNPDALDEFGNRCPETLTPEILENWRGG